MQQLFDPRLRHASGTTVRLHMYLAAEAEHYGRSWTMPSVQTLAAKLKRDRRTIQRAIADLRARGLLA